MKDFKIIILCNVFWMFYIFSSLWHYILKANVNVFIYTLIKRHSKKIKIKKKNVCNIKFKIRNHSDNNFSRRKVVIFSWDNSFCNDFAYVKDNLLCKRKKNQYSFPFLNVCKLFNFDYTGRKSIVINILTKFSFWLFNYKFHFVNLLLFAYQFIIIKYQL